MSFLDKLGNIAYPTLVIPHNVNPNRFFAVPVLGFVVRIVALIPVFFILIVMSFVALFAILINICVVLFTGKYWEPAFNLLSDLSRRSVNISTYIFGLTDKYPGFDSKLLEGIQLEIPHPDNPKRLYAVPLLGLLIRIILGIPLILLMQGFAVIVQILMITMWVPVLFTGKYPFVIHNFMTEYIRFMMGQSFYLYGFVDSPPRLEFSYTKERMIVYILIVVGLLFSFSSFGSPKKQMEYYPQNYDYNNMMQESGQEQPNYNYDYNMEGSQTEGTNAL